MENEVKKSCCLRSLLTGATLSVAALFSSGCDTVGVYTTTDYYPYSYHRDVIIAPPVYVHPSPRYIPPPRIHPSPRYSPPQRMTPPPRSPPFNRGPPSSPRGSPQGPRNQPRR